uniref:Peptidase S1 domain-containing protein n=1 Tax=Ascaris lumbricoides TaxID=6252 RepID=A0A0M3IAH4_ASCLU
MHIATRNFGVDVIGVIIGTQSAEYGSRAYAVLCTSSTPFAVHKWGAIVKCKSAHFPRTSTGGKPGMTCGDVLLYHGGAFGRSTENHSYSSYRYS